MALLMGKLMGVGTGSPSLLVTLGHMVTQLLERRASWGFTVVTRCGAAFMGRVNGAVGSLYYACRKVKERPCNT
jgi:hypothetical protein